MIALIDFSATDETEDQPTFQKITIKFEILNFFYILILQGIIYGFGFFNIVNLYLTYPEDMYFYSEIDVLIIGTVFLGVLVLQYLFLSPKLTRLDTHGWFVLRDNFRKGWLAGMVSPFLIYLLTMWIFGHTYTYHKLAVFVGLATAVAIFLFHSYVLLSVRQLKLCEIQEKS